MSSSRKTIREIQAKALRPFLSISLIMTLVPATSFSQQVVVAQSGLVTTAAPSKYSASSGGGLDYENAIPMPLPTNPIKSSLLSSNRSGLKSPGSVPGRQGNGKGGVVKVGVENPENFVEQYNDEVAPSEYGTSNHPFTSSRVDTNPALYKTSRLYPYRATGKLYFNIGSSTYVCSASLIKPGVIVTAAHCVADFGESTFFSNFEFHPAKFNNYSKTGTWGWANATVLSSYYDGTDSCEVSGIVCENDVALIKLAGRKSNTYYPGHRLGWYGYGWDGYGFTDTHFGVSGAQISQLGYPASHDNGLKMQRNDSLGYTDSSVSNNTIIGSRLTGGSSGGPWLVNLGRKPKSDVSFGSDSRFNIVVGVASWGYISDGPKQQGASPFTSDNIVVLMNSSGFCPDGTTEKHCVK